MFKLKIFQKIGKLSKSDKFVTNKTKKCFFVSFSYFYEIKSKLSADSISHVVLSENLLNETN